MFQPPGDMLSSRVVMRPVYYTATFVPFVNAEERHFFAHVQVRNARRQIYVVRYEQGPARVQPQDYSLMPAAIAVIRQYAGHGTASPDLRP